MDERELVDLLRLGHEIPGVEFKGPGPRTDRLLFAKVVRAVLGMANRRSGGHVIVGVEDSDPMNSTGMTTEDLTTWTFDEVSEQVGAYADPFVDLRLEHRSVELLKGVASLVVVEVEEFAYVPILCKKDYNHQQKTSLRNGGCYIRRRGQAETIEIPNHSEMRELLDLATEKGIRRFNEMAARSGLNAAGIDSAQRYREEQDSFE